MPSFHNKLKSRTKGVKIIETITDIRYEGYYVSDDDGMSPREHTKETFDLYNKALSMVDDIKYYVCDGVSFINGHPYAELIDFDYELRYKEI